MWYTINVSKLNNKLGKILSDMFRKAQKKQHCTPSETMALLRNFGSAEEEKKGKR